MLIQANPGFSMLKLSNIKILDESKEPDDENVILTWERYPIIAYSLLDEVGHKWCQSYVLLGMDEDYYGPILCPDGSVLVTSFTQSESDYYVSMEKFDAQAVSALWCMCRRWLKSGFRSYGNGLFEGVKQIQREDIENCGVDAIEGLEELYDLVEAQAKQRISV